MTFLFFVNWQSTVLYLLQRRLQNIKGYEKRKTHGKTKRSGSDDVEFGEKEVEELHAQLLREVQSKKKNYAAIKEIQQNTFDFRRKDIKQMSDKSVVSEIISHYPFLQVHECTVSIALTVIAKTRLIASCPQILYSNVSFQKISRILPCNVFSFAIFVALYNPLKILAFKASPPPLRNSSDYLWMGYFSQDAL